MFILNYLLYVIAPTTGPKNTADVTGKIEKFANLIAFVFPLSTVRARGNMLISVYVDPFAKEINNRTNY